MDLNHLARGGGSIGNSFLLRQVARGNKLLLQMAHDVLPMGSTAPSSAWNSVTVPFILV